VGKRLRHWDDFLLIVGSGGVHALTKRIKVCRITHTKQSEQITKREEVRLSEVTTAEAKQILLGDASIDTIRRALDIGKLRGRRKGVKRAVRIEVDSLREWARAMNYRFDEQLAKELGK
jgi:hypothetical protein